MDKNNDEVALLVAQSGPLNGQRWALQDSLLVGRDSFCDIVIPDRQVSRNHARFTLTAEGVLVEDLASKNGTHINGKPMIDAAYLQDGDVIQIALAQKFVFLSSDATLPLESDYDKLQTDYMNAFKQQQPAVIEIEGRLRMDKRSHRVWIRTMEQNDVGSSRNLKTIVNEKEIDPPLSASQFKMLEILYDQQGRIVSRQDLIAWVWGLDEAIGVSEQALDALIRRLRDRLAGVDPTHMYIITVRGHGLRLDNPSLKD
ncbi:MAG: hypothetical protein H6Q37_70 [Chloroflexi bacterium]|jgi:hypothetical protein|nr:hypothetical protein [Chloroflexota bacterium]